MNSILTSFFAFLASFLIVQDDFAKADLAVVLSGAFPRGVLEAGDLYRGKRVSGILLVRERERRAAEKLPDELEFPDTTDLQESYLRWKGIPKESIWKTPQRADSTKAEAKAVGHFLKEHSEIRHIVVISRKFQSRRARRIFRAMDFDNIEVSVRFSRHTDLTKENFWKDPWGVYEFTIESLKWVYDGITTLLPFLHYESPGANPDTKLAGPAGNLL